MTPYYYEIATYLLLIIAVIVFLKRNNEFLFLPVIFFLNTGISRYEAVLSGKANWAIVNYTFQQSSYHIWIFR